MKVLLCAATEVEIAPTVQELMTLPDDNVAILITGVGLMAATYKLMMAISSNRPDIVIQAGLAGSLDEQLSLASVVVVSSETAGDIGVVEENNFYSVFDLKLLDGEAFPWTKRKLVNTSNLLSVCGLPLVEAVSVNEISTSPERINYYRRALSAQIESMEGAALHYVCLNENIPFLQLRSLSNFIGERDKTKWRMKEAIENLNCELQRILKTVLQ